MKCIQFVGRIGAGKSAMAALTVENLQAQGIEAIDQPEAVRRCAARTGPGRVATRLRLGPAVTVRVARWSALAGVALHHPALLPRGAMSLLRSPIPWGHRGLIMGLFVRAAAASRLIDRHLTGTEVAVIDEGLLHRAVNLFAWRRDRVDAAVRAYVAGLPPLGVVVVVASTESTIAGRLDERGYPKRLVAAEPATVERVLANAAHVVDVVGEELPRRADPMVAVANDRPLDEMSDELAAVLEPHLDGLVGWATRTGPTLPARPAWSVPRPDRGRSRHERGTWPDDQVDGVLDHYALLRSGPPRPVGQLGRSQTLVVPTGVGPVFVKRYKDTVDDAAIANEHDLLSHLAGQQYPATRLIDAADGGTLVRTDAGRFALFEYLDGYFHTHQRLWAPRQSAAFAELAGRTLASLHQAMASFPVTIHGDDGFTAVDGDRVRGAGWAEDTVRYARAVGGTDVAQELHELAVPVVARMRFLEERLTTAHLTRGQIHGDYGPYNVLYHWGRPPVVVDFELTRFDWLITDAAKALGQFGLSRRRIRTSRVADFLAGYRTASALPDDEIALAPAVWEYLVLRRVVVGWQRAAESGDQRHLDGARRRAELARSIDVTTERWVVPEHLEQRR